MHTRSPQFFVSLLLIGCTHSTISSNDLATATDGAVSGDASTVADSSMPIYSDGGVCLTTTPAATLHMLDCASAPSHFCLGVGQGPD